MHRFRRLLAALTTLGSASVFAGCASSTPPEVPLQTVTLTIGDRPVTAVSLNRGDRVTLRPIVLDKSGAIVTTAAITYVMEDASIATVTPDGIVSGVNFGSTAVIVRAAGRGSVVSNGINVSVMGPATSRR